jgi:tRNA/tmRNA/rRNA uracil-C5-methylase (TrmA/RlmC/RlmD family)
MVVFITYKKKVKHLSHIASILASEFPEIKSVIQNVNERHDNVILGDEEILLYGEDVIEDTLLDKRYHISMKWFQSLRRRSQRHRLTWKRMTQLIDRFLPSPCVLHPWPDQRFGVTYSR